MVTEPRITPFWEQYQRLKAQHPDALLWTRMGDFYEMFEEDARTGARELHITLTSREFGKEFRVPMAGVPYHAAESYLARLIRRGYHVAICEQMSEAGRGLVDREVVRVVTPGTLAQPGLLPQRANNYLAAVLWRDGAAGLAYLDVSTGEFFATQFTGPDAAALLDAEIRRVSPAECLTPDGQTEPCALPGHQTRRDPWHFDEGATREALLHQFATESLVPFGCDGSPLATACAGALVGYVRQTDPALLQLLTTLRAYNTGEFMQLDGPTRRNLNLIAGAHGGHDGSLLAVLDQTRTVIGARLLRRWIGQPLVDTAAIMCRQEIVAALVAERQLRSDLRLLFERVLDVERIVGRCRSGAATPRELWAIHHALEVAAAIRYPGGRDFPDALRDILGDFDPCADVTSTIACALAEPGAGRTIATGYSAELDALVEAVAADRDWIGCLEAQERHRTGIKSLKVGVNKVFGYYIEVTNPNRSLVPVTYIRKQTVAGAERYVTPELKEIEARLLRADEEIVACEQRLFAELLCRLAAEGERLLHVAARLAEVDVCCALAELADRQHWIRPLVDDSLTLEVKNGRHPVVEAALPSGGFIPNDCTVQHEGARLLLITGPNMAGKSTYLRQAAVIALLAQIGSYVPADSARIGIVDRIFTRVGAHDDLAGGASTFLVEMVETATICRQATPRSLVILDEVGRGTSSDDGRAIAQAVAEYLHDTVGARTLFATHFHDLAALADTLAGLELWTFAVLDQDDEIAFTHRLAPGVASRAYGLHVARLAGLPPAVIARAQALVAAAGDQRAAELDRPTAESPPPSSLAMETARPESPAGDLIAHRCDRGADLRRLAQEIAEIDIVRTTPLAALIKLAELQLAAKRSLSS